MTKINTPIKKVLKNLGVKQIRKVPIRKKGFTGRMPKGNCHSNVAYLVCKYGGRQVTGYVVDKFSNPIFNSTESILCIILAVVSPLKDNVK